MPRGLQAVVLALVALTLQGCDPACKPQEPSIADWEADFEALNKKAGCKDEWTWNRGNPCASDVPVVFAKKGYESDADKAHYKGSVRNLRYDCMDYAPEGYCQRWAAEETRCDVKDFGVCTCKEAGKNGNKYCHAWQCIVKEAGQSHCREECCGLQCEPCVDCGEPHSNPFPVDIKRYDQLMALDGMSAAIHVGQYEAVNILRKRYWENFDFLGECMSPRDVKSTADVPCRTWREVQTRIAWCHCKEPATDGTYCKAWRCDRKDAGLFAVLFTKNMSYDGLVEGLPSEDYECLSVSFLATGNIVCQKWRGEADRYSSVDEMQCRASCSATQCDQWHCNLYSMERIHDEDEWGKRLLFCCVHLLWMWIPLLVLAGNHEGMSRRSTVALSPCGLAFACLLIWTVGFVRWIDDEHRWRLPAWPLTGLLLMLGPAWLLTSLIWCLCPQRRLVGTSPILLVLPPLALMGIGWTVGFFPIFGVCFLLLLCLVVVCCRRWHRSRQARRKVRDG